MIGLAFTCVLGLLVGGVLGGVAVFQQIRMGRIKIPPTITFDPVKLDISGLSPQTGVTTQETDVSSMRPLLEGSGSATGGCLSLIGAGMVLVGFVLPWFTCSIPMLAIQGSVSDFSALVQPVFGVLQSLESLGILFFWRAMPGRLRNVQLGGNKKPIRRDTSLDGGQRPLKACYQTLKWDFIFFGVARGRFELPTRGL
ncbi:MAG: hypothetical protein L0Y56_16855 [Nitrospira sp.]|nr:hypothetical protein [Nitrospira sp.]